MQQPSHLGLTLTLESIANYLLREALTDVLGHAETRHWENKMVSWKLTLSHREAKGLVEDWGPLTPAKGSNVLCAVLKPRTNDVHAPWEAGPGEVPISSRSKDSVTPMTRLDDSLMPLL